MPSSLSSDIIGHAAVLHLLELWLQKPASGYVFYGPAHVGKRTIAERFVGALLSVIPVKTGILADQKEQGSRLRGNDTGLHTTHGPLHTLSSHPDFIILEAEEGKSMVSVEAVRKARSRLLERPMVAERMVCFIPRLDRLNEEGMNALLKVLEEPPAAAVFVAITEDLSRLPATVQSRMVKVPFNLVPRKDLIDGLRARGIADDEASRRADESRGRPGLALLHQTDDRSTSHKKQAERFIHASSVGERLMIIEEMAKACDSSDSAADAWNAVLEDWTDATRFALQDNPALALVVGQGIISARRLVGGALSPRLALEAVALRLAGTEPLNNLFPAPIHSSIPAIFQF